MPCGTVDHRPLQSGEDLLVFDFAASFEGNYVSDAAAIAAIGGAVNEAAYSQSLSTLSINSFDLASFDVLRDYTIQLHRVDEL